MEKQVVVINGTGGSGKDTFIEFVAKYNKIMNVSSVDKVKEIAKIIGWDGQKEEKDRKFLSDLKRLTTEYNDMAFVDISEKVEEFNNSDNEIMFIHIREPEEIERAVKAFNAKSLLVRRKGLDAITTNYSDASVENYNYDLYILNDTLEQLEIDAMNFAEKLK